MKSITFLRNNNYWYASYYCEDGRLRYPSGVNINDDPVAECGQLQKIDDFVTQYITKQRDILHGPILKKELRNYLDLKLGKKKREVKLDNNNSFFSDCEALIKEMRTGKILKKRNKDRYSDSTLNQAQYSLNRLKCIEREAMGKFKISYEFDLVNYQNLLVWLISKDYSRNYIFLLVNTLKGFLTRTYESGKHNNKFFENKEFNYGPEASDSIALNLAELQTIYNLKLTGKREQKRDFFIWGCFVALRIKDLSRTHEYLLNNNRFELLHSKTGKKVLIPVHWIAKEIYEKYNGKIPICKPKALREALPKICKMAGITGNKLIAMTIGGRKIEQIFNKCELVQPHTMRRSFCTFMYKELGFKPKQIMPISGHTTEAQFFKYIKIDEEENVEEILSHPGFKKPELP